MAVTISRGLLDRLIGEAAAHPAHEICGLLLGDMRRIDDARSAPNVADNIGNSFEVDPRALFEALRGGRVIGHYHSHPNGLAEPSARDAAAAGDGGRLWLILTGRWARLWREVNGGAHLGRFDPVELIIV